MGILVLHETLVTVISNKQTPKIAIPNNGIHECAIDAMKAFSGTANRWESDVLLPTGDPVSNS